MDSPRLFAEAVAPLYKYNNWLGLGDKTLEEAQGRVEEIARNLYEHVRDTIALGDEPGFASTGRVIVHYQPYTNDPNEITIGLDVTTLILTEDGYVDIDDERFAA